MTPLQALPPSFMNQYCVGASLLEPFINWQVSSILLLLHTPSSATGFDR